MSDTLTLKRQNKPSSPQTKHQQTLRQVKPKTLSPSSLTPLGYGRTEILTVDIPAEWTFADVMKPIAWSSVVGPVAANAAKTQVDRIGSLIYVNSVDNRFMAWLRIEVIIRDELKNPNGLKVMCVGPSIDPKTGKPCPLDLKTGLAWSDSKKPEVDQAA